MRQKLYRVTFFPDYMSTQGYTTQCVEYDAGPNGVAIEHRNGDMSVFPYHAFARVQVVDETPEASDE